MSEVAIQINQEVEVKPGYKLTKLGWIPKEWDLKCLGEVTSITRLAGYEYSEYWEETENGEIIGLRGYNIGKGRLLLNDIARISNALSQKLKRSRLEIGDVVYPCVGTIGNAVVIEENDKYHIQQNIAKISCQEACDPYYLVQFLMSDLSLKEVIRFNATSSQPNVLVGSLRQYRFRVPPLPEQQKIAQILITWDKAITKTEQLIAQKRKRKKGLMQQLLTGKKRFKEFVKSDKMKETKLGWIPEDWEVKKVSDVFDFLATNSFSRSQMHYDVSGSSIYNIHYGDIHATYKEAILDFEIEESVPIIFDDIQIPNSAFYLKDGDVIIADASEDYEGVGEAIELKNIDERKVLAGLHTFALRDKSSLTSIGFRAYIFKNPKVSKAIKVIATGSKVFGISKANLTKFELILPTVEEQNRIAYFFSSADQEIASLQNQLAKLKEQKKGLMQKLLTGEVRVKID